MKKAILMLIIAIIVTVAFVSCHKEDVEWNTFEYTVSPSDTLWEIAEKYCPEGMDKREYIYEVEKINNINAGDLFVGQTVTLLTTEKGVN